MVLISRHSRELIQCFEIFVKNVSLIFCTITASVQTETLSISWDYKLTYQTRYFLCGNQIYLASCSVDQQLYIMSLSPHVNKTHLSLRDDGRIKNIFSVYCPIRHSAKSEDTCTDSCAVRIRVTLIGVIENKAGEECNTAAFQGFLKYDSTKSYSRKGVFDIQISGRHSSLLTTAYAPLLSKTALPSGCSKFSSYLAQLAVLLWKHGILLHLKYAYCAKYYY